MAFPVVAGEIVNLNVGGCIYTTSRSTLTRYPDSMLGSMFSDRLPTNVDDGNRYIIDRDGPTFRHILNFLRQSKLILPDGFQEWDILSAEADYYQIQELIQIINETRQSATAYEFLEVEYNPLGIDKTLRIFCKPKLIEQSLATAIDFKLESTGKEHRLRSKSRGYSMAEYSGYKFELSCYVGDRIHVNRLKLFREITKIGFRLISTASGSNCSTDRWTFSRKEIAND
ncbi:BTB/POZ domain-containing protein KCTD6-like [Anneissia japonica]|uniref:BTB/POZ domain-containing protein KCTD6-like n=1 Tax=Anneissia japonica TaxID=1529436 RepID=UPI0014259730|nr:BTB/POZ domain-containing protein KCTD6-like [Anneissia japonica]